MRFGIICPLVAGSSSGPARGGIVEYTDPAALQQAAGHVTGSENFDEFASDAQFRTATVAVNNMTIAGTTG